MRSFYDLPLICDYPSIALDFERCKRTMDLSNYRGPRGVSEFLACSERAHDIRETASIARALGFGEVQLVRLSNGAGGSMPLGWGNMPSLEEIGEFVFAICDDDKLYSGTIQPVVARFMLLCALATGVNSGSRWGSYAALEVIQRCAGIRLGATGPFSPSNELLDAEPEWWGLPVPASTAEVDAFVAVIADRCESLRELSDDVLPLTVRWVQQSGYRFGTMNALVAAYKSEVRYTPGTLMRSEYQQDRDQAHG